MNQSAIREYIAQTLVGVDIIDASGGTFFFFDPEHKFPFATITTSDEYDQASNLNRPGVFRLNIGVTKQTFQSVFGTAADREWDFTALDQLMPHPVYAPQYWLCVLNPGPVTFETVKGLLAQAYQRAVDRRNRRNANDTDE